MDDWQNQSYLLFANHTRVPVIFDASVQVTPKIIAEKITQNCTVTSTLKQEEISFTTTCIGLPHIIKVSYFPRWKSNHGEKIYLVSPSFMLVYPTQETTRLTFARTPVENTSLVLSVLGWIIILAYAPLARKAAQLRKLLPKSLRDFF